MPTSPEKHALWLKKHPHKNGFYCYNHKRRKAGKPGISEREYMELRTKGLPRGMAAVRGTDNALAKRYMLFLELLEENQLQLKYYSRYWSSKLSISALKERIPPLAVVPYAVLRRALRKVRAGRTLRSP